MLWTICLILLVLWVLGLLGNIGGGLVHILIVIALICVIANFVGPWSGGGPDGRHGWGRHGW